MNPEGKESHSRPNEQSGFTPLEGSAPEVRNTHHSLTGFTLVEMMVVVVIIGILATIFITQFGGQVDKASRQATRGIIRQVEGALDSFKLDNGHYPDRLEDLLTKPSDAKNWPKGGYLKSFPKDGWGNNFEYNPRSTNPNVLYEIISRGADGKIGGTDENEDLYNYDTEKK